MIKDMLVYLEKVNEEECNTNQCSIGMKYLFRGHPAKVWKGMIFPKCKCEQANKVLVRHYVSFYKECWDYRSGVRHDPRAQRERVIKWHKKMKVHIKKTSLYM